MNLNVMDKLMTTFLIAVVFAGVGVIVGSFIPVILLFPIAIAELALIFIIAFSRKKKVGYLVMYGFMFLSGITLYVSINSYVLELGVRTVFAAFIITVIVFSLIALYGIFTKFDYGFLGNILFFALLAMVVILIVGIFMPFSGALETVVSAFGIVLFGAYTLYDFNKIAKRGLKEEDIPMTVLSIYLDFVNLFLYVLRFVSSLKRD